MSGYVALLRGINVGGHRKVPMAALRETAEALGLRNVRTYVASGNLVFESEKAAGTLEALLEKAIAHRFGFAVDVVVRSAAQLSALVAANPLMRECDKQPAFVHMSVGKRAPTEADVAALAAKAGSNECVMSAGGAIWIWFGDGAGQSKIGTGKSTGVWTARNWRTILALQEMLEA
jgi:uncharacterized protein (DUF1697 family)